MTLALLAAVLGALLYGAGSVLQAAGARRASGPAVFRQPAYLVGLVCDGAAWLASLVALRRLPLFAVQGLLAGSLAVTVVLAAVLLGTRLRRPEAVAVAVVVVALAVLAASAGTSPPSRAPGGFAVAILLALVLLGAVAAAAYRRGASVALAALAGLGFSGAALCARGVHGSGAHLLTRPLTFGVLAYGALGLVLYARSLERGPVGPATAVLWVVEVAVPAAVGVAVLHDEVRHGWGAAAAVALLVALACCLVLAKDPDPAAVHT